MDFKLLDKLKNADISPIFKGQDPTSRVNFRPVGILPSISEIYERILKEQMSHVFKDKLRDIRCGFREGNSTQHALLRVIEKWKKSLENSGVVGTILMDL